MEHFTKTLSKSAEHIPSFPSHQAGKQIYAAPILTFEYPAGWENAREIKVAQGITSPAPRDYVGISPLIAPESRAVYDFTLKHDFALTFVLSLSGTGHLLAVS